MGRRRGAERGLITLLFTDIVGSSEVANELGDERWHRLQARHHATVRKQLKWFGGHEVDTAGDGFFITFPSPARGVRCAFAIVREVRDLGLDVRAGLHIGEAQLTGEKVGGIAVTTAARVSAFAGPGQVFATDTIVHMVAGSALEFTDIGPRELKGVPRLWELFSLDAVDGESIGVPLDPRKAVELRERASPPPASKTARLRLVVAGAVVVVLVAGVVVFERSRSEPGPRASTSEGPRGPAVVVNEVSGDAPFSVSVQGGWADQVVLTPSTVGPSTYAWIRSGGCGAMNACPGKLSLIDGNSGANVQQFPFDPLAVAEAKGTVWFLTTNHGRGVFAQSIDSSLDPPTRPIPIVRKVGIAWIGRPGDVVQLEAGGNALWIGDTIDSKVFRLDLSSRRVTPYQIAGDLDDIAFGDGYLWVMDGVTASVTRIDPRGGKPKTLSVSQLDTLTSITFGGGYVWATDNSANEVWRISKDLNSPTPIAVGIAPRDVTYADGVVWVANYGDGTVSVVNPRIPSLTRSIPVAVHPRAVAVADGKVWAVGDAYTINNE